MRMILLAMGHYSSGINTVSGQEDPDPSGMLVLKIVFIAAIAAPILVWLLGLLSDKLEVRHWQRLEKQRKDEESARGPLG